jgi:ubiquinone/menaquinone biosynthesis C-methylase UbiE
MKCSVCCSPASNVWEIASGIIPNHYHKELKKEKKSSQGIFFCETCQTLENVHSFSEDDLFSNYVYRTPNTSMDEEIANYLATFINKNNIEKVVEVAGNNGIFAKKVIDLLDKDIDITIVDKVKLDVNDRRIHHINSFLEENNRDLFSKIKSDLVIVRHALAHNKDIKKFLHNIIDILNPKFIYIENASLLSTYEKDDFSQLYSEHFYQISPKTISTLAQNNNFFLNEINYFEIHNGSFGALISKEMNEFKISDSESISSEELKSKISAWSKSVEDFWNILKTKDKKIAVWGCSAKFLFTYSALNLSSIKKLSYVIDSTPEKEGLYAPGTSVKVIGEDKVNNLEDDLLFVIGARNFEQHITSKILTLNPKAHVFIPPF